MARHVPDGHSKLVPWETSVELQTWPQLPQLLVVLKFVDTQLVPALFGQRLPEHAVALHVPDGQVKLVPYCTSLELQTCPQLPQLLVVFKFVETQVPLTGQ